MLRADELRRALTAISLWRAGSEEKPVCPRCGKGALAISDHSARPHAEWYHLACPDCRLDEMLHIPLGQPPGD